MENRGGIMRNFETTVPFDPGYAPKAFSFIERIQTIKDCYAQLTTNAQKKLWLPGIEPEVMKLIRLNAAFHLGCILWGGFLAYRFKDSPKQIEGNTTLDLSAEEKKDLDCAADAKAALEYIKNFDRDCKYFLRRGMKIPPEIKEIYENYIEFTELNNNFVNVKTTSDIKVPKAIAHFKDLSNEQLDVLCESIYMIINTEELLFGLLDLGFYKA
jgi:hypothetical protein